MNGAAQDFVAGNHFDKYATRNPLYRVLMRGFLRAATDLVHRTAPHRVLEVGCGAGELAHLLFPDGDEQYVGVDISSEQIERARNSNPSFEFRTASAYELPFADESFDLVVACEVLEHLERPDVALAEIERVGSGHVLVSVPWEPVWCMLNVARGAYLSRWGNTPGHVQRFSRRAIRRLVDGRFELVAERRPFPWTMLLARKPTS